MDIQILQLLEGARQARGLTVVLDVFRAFSTACYVFGNGAQAIIPVDDLEVAYALKRAHPKFLLIGERHGEKLPGFDFGNSPSEIEHVKFTGRTVVQTTSAGTQGLANARHAEEILAGSFCNAGALIAYIRAKRPQQVALVCMGEEARESSVEDTLCAQYIKANLEGQTPDFDQMRRFLCGTRGARKFFDPEILWAPPEDFDLCLALNRFNFVMRVEVGENKLQILKKVLVEEFSS